MSIANFGTLPVAYGQATVTGTATVVTGLKQVIAAVACYDDDLVLATNEFCSCTIGDQAGSPAAGSIIVKTWKATASGDVTPVAGTGSKKVNWIAIGN